MSVKKSLSQAQRHIRVVLKNLRNEFDIETSATLSRELKELVTTLPTAIPLRPIKQRLREISSTLRDVNYAVNRNILTNLAARKEVSGLYHIAKSEIPELLTALPSDLGQSTIPHENSLVNHKDPHVYDESGEMVIADDDADRNFINDVYERVSKIPSALTKTVSLVQHVPILLLGVDKNSASQLSSFIKIKPYVDHYVLFDNQTLLGLDTNKLKKEYDRYVEEQKESRKLARRRGDVRNEAALLRENEEKINKLQQEFALLNAKHKEATEFGVDDQGRKTSRMPEALQRLTSLQQRLTDLKRPKLTHLYTLKFEDWLEATAHNFLEHYNHNHSPPLSIVNDTRVRRGSVVYFWIMDSRRVNILLQRAHHLSTYEWGLPTKKTLVNEKQDTRTVTDAKIELIFKYMRAGLNDKDIGEKVGLNKHLVRHLLSGQEMPDKTFKYRKLYQEMLKRRFKETVKKDSEKLKQSDKHAQQMWGARRFT